MNSITNEGKEKVMERHQFNNGVEIISFKEKPKEKQTIIKRLLSFLRILPDLFRLFKPLLAVALILSIASIVTLSIILHYVYADTRKDTMEYMIGCIENYYEENSYSETELRNYEVLDSKDAVTYINSYCNDKESEGDIFAFKEGKMKLLDYKNALKSVIHFCELNNFKFLGVKFDKRDKLVVYCTIGYDFDNSPYIKHLKLYFPTGEVLDTGDATYNISYIS